MGLATVGVANTGSTFNQRQEPQLFHFLDIP
jgi:hypothetical protein